MDFSAVITDHHASLKNQGNPVLLSTDCSVSVVGLYYKYFPVPLVFHFSFEF